MPEKFPFRPSLHIKGISKCFGGNVVLDSVSFQVQPREVVLLTGANGCGKTTLFNIISGFMMPDSGAACVNGFDLPLGDPSSIAKMGIRRTFQEVRVFGTMSVLDNILVGGYGGNENIWSGIRRGHCYTKREEELKEKAMSALEQVRLADRADDRVSDLSFGQQKLVEIARALVDSPPVMLLDEPIAGVHQELAHEIVQVLDGLRQTNRALLIVEHEQDVVAPIVSTTMVLENGRLAIIDKAANECS